MQHRTTIYRWRTGKALPRGKRMCKKNPGRIDWRGRRSKFDDGAGEQRLRLVAEKFSEVFQAIEIDQLHQDLCGLWKGGGAHVDLIATCAFDCLWRRLSVRRTRKPSKQQIEELLWAKDDTGDHMVRKLRKYQPDYPKSQAIAIVSAARRSGDWGIYTALLDTPAVISQSDILTGKPCVSKMFHGINRKMAYYWRKHKDYERVKDSLERLIRKQLSSWRLALPA